MPYEEIWGSAGIVAPFLTSAVDGGEQSASRPCLFTPGGRTRGTYWIGSQGWSGICGDKTNFAFPGIKLALWLCRSSSG
jgi:hypothetical protein